MKALYFEEFGTSEVLKYGDLPKPELAENQVLVRTAYIGLNFADIYRRRGHYQIEKNQPYINGYEASGEIVEVGNSKNSDLTGRKVLFVDVPLANAEFVAVPVEHLIFLPQEISLKMAATIGLQGLTADFLAHDLGNNIQGQKAFVTGISGGVGQILSQILIADKIEVYGSARTEEKRQLALKAGARQVISGKNLPADFVGQFDTVYDGLGATLNQSLSLLKNRGKLIFFGMAAGNPPQVDFIDLLAHSKSILTGDLWDFLDSFEERKIRSERLFKYFTEGKIKTTEPRIFDLSEGKAAHNFLESGQSIGKVLFKNQ